MLYALMYSSKNVDLTLLKFGQKFPRTIIMLCYEYCEFSLKTLPVVARQISMSHHDPIHCNNFNILSPIITKLHRFHKTLGLKTKTCNISMAASYWLNSATYTAQIFQQSSPRSAILKMERNSYSVSKSTDASAGVPRAPRRPHESSGPINAACSFN